MHALQIVARCENDEATGETNMPADRTTDLRLPLLGLALLAAGAGGAAAADPADPFVLVAYSNRSGGEKLSSGDYGNAAQTLYTQTSAGATSDPEALSTNRCVAYAMTRQLERAHRACDEAVRQAQGAEGVLALWNPQMRSQSDEAQAVAYSNRAVLHWLDADLDAAQADLARARALAPEATFVQRNLQAMQLHQAGENRTAATARIAPAAQE